MVLTASTGMPPFTESSSNIGYRASPAPYALSVSSRLDSVNSGFASRLTPSVPFDTAGSIHSTSDTSSLQYSDPMPIPLDLSHSTCAISSSLENRPPSDKQATGAASLKSSLMESQIPTFAPVSTFSSINPTDIPLSALLTINIPLTGSSSNRRVRSGSLFSTSSIWNDDAVLVNSPSRALSNSVVLDPFPDSIFLSGPNGSVASSKPVSAFISPSLTAQTSLSFSNQTRNRSHTTSGSIHGFAPKQPLDSSRLSVSPFLKPIPNDPSTLLDNPILNSLDASVHKTRNRSQTYSGVTPKLSEATLSSINPALALQNPLIFTHVIPPNDQLMLQDGVPHSHSIMDYHTSLALGIPVPQVYLHDDFNFNEVSITTTFENPNLGPTLNLLFSNLPQFIDSRKLFQILNNPTGNSAPFHNRGVASVRVSPRSGSKIALVGCSSIEASMNFKAYFNHLELLPGSMLYVAFAKVTEQYPVPPLGSQPLASTSPNPLKLQESMLHPNRVYNEPSTASKAYNESNAANKAPSPAPKSDTIDLLMDIISRLSVSMPIDLQKVVSMIKKAEAYPKRNYQSNFGPLPDTLVSREFDSPKLRELRKVLENSEKAQHGNTTVDSNGECQTMSQLELEALALAMLDELPEICYDHIGNTIVQRIFSVLESPAIKLILVKEIAPYFTQIGIHKNGTWAIQKIINICQTDYNQMVLIADSLKPYAGKLFNDQFGNYVLQCCLKFGSPFNDFIFETMYDNFLEISSGRFGARCIRTILETANDSKNGSSTAYVSNEQLYLIAGLIVQNANELAINSNGSLLITWFLDTFNGWKNADHDYRHSLLCDQLISNLESLCTHKLGNLTVSKILANRTDIASRRRLMNAIFGPFNEMDLDVLRPPPNLLESILQDNGETSAGPLFIYKIITNPVHTTLATDAASQRYQQFIVGQVKRVLLETNIVNLLPYKKLIDELGLTSGRLGRPPSNSKGKRNPANVGNGPSRSTYTPSQILNGQPNSMAAYSSMGHGYGGPGALNMYCHPAHNGDMNGTDYLVFPPMAIDRTVQEQEFMVMRELEQLSLSSLAMGYGSNPQTPSAVSSMQGNLFF